MSSPLEFIQRFAALLREHEIDFALTSGMACVHYGLQQNTKDSDWIIAVEDLDRLRDFLTKMEGALPSWRVSYRGLFGAPLDATFLKGGWTSHLSIWDEALSPEHHVDLFGKAPRISLDGWRSRDGDYADRDIVARMKKTDRPKDWPMVDGLGVQSWLLKEPKGLLHLRTPDLLLEAWRKTPEIHKIEFQVERPLLGQLDSIAPLALERLLNVERLIWESVNRFRYQTYQHEWKNFYRRWQENDVGRWPTTEPFRIQHQRVIDAIAIHGLPSAPLDSMKAKREIYSLGMERATVISAATAAELHACAPPLEVLLP